MPTDLEKNMGNNSTIHIQRLRRFIQLNPDSIWADDAQYIIATLNASLPDQGAKELEYLLEKYPDMHAEEWTKANLPIIPTNMALAVRFELLLHYKRSGNNDKLKALYEESIKKFPDLKKMEWNRKGFQE